MFYLLDCLEGMKKLEDGSIDAIVTSPPYNLNIKYGKYSDDKPRQEYLDWLVSCLLYTSPSPRDATLSRMPSSA